MRLARDKAPHRDKALNFSALKGSGRRGSLLIILSSVLLLFSILLFLGVNVWTFNRPITDLRLFFQNRGYVSNPALSNKWGGLTRLVVNGINPVQSNSLPTIHLNIKHKNYIKLWDQINAGGGFLSFGGDPFWVPGTIDYKGETIKVKIRNRGETRDHRDSNKWSFRIHTKGDKSLLGMREFSIQHPKTRMYLMEWVYTNHLLKEGVLSPRYEFINVVFNGTPKGIFSIEEHFSRELIESQKRREGILLRYDADPAILSHALKSRRVSFNHFSNALIRPYEKSRIEKNDNLKVQYQVAHKLLDDFRNLKKETSQVFDIPITARYLAVTELWNACHGEMFNNIRFYYNPVTSLLEPIGYDGATIHPNYLIINQDKLCTFNTSEFVLELLSDKKLAVAFEKELSRVSSPDYVDQLLQGMAGEYEALREDLLMEYPFIPKFSDLHQVMKERARIIHGNEQPRRTDGTFTVRMTADERIKSLPRVLGYYTADSEESSKLPTIRLHVASTFPEPVEFFGVEIKNKDGWITIPAKELTVISDISGNPEWLPAKRFRRPSEYRVFSLPQNLSLEGTERENLSIDIIVKAITDDKVHRHRIAYSYFSPVTNELND